MIRVKQHILTATGEVPKYVRAVGGELAAPRTLFGGGKVRQVYDKFSLKHIAWDVDSHDNKPPRPDATKVAGNLAAGVAAALADGKSDLVVLFHDINDVTAGNLAKYIEALANAVQVEGRSGAFARSREEIDTLFSRRHDGN
jgi:hypothetical protein